MTKKVTVETDLKGLKLLGRGKVRDIYDLGEHLLIVATDRISAFDVIMQNGIPDKGKTLTRISKYWFEVMNDIAPNHLVSANVRDFPQECQEYKDVLEGRSMWIIIADTKFEFGIFNGGLMLIDELLTPDSSRFWPKDEYKPGRAQKSFDKQFLRDYLLSINWDKSPPPPELPEDIIEKTREKYLEALKRLVGYS